MAIKRVVGHPRRGRAWFALLVASGVAPPVCAQVTWDAQLAIDPFPSPYLSDWEANPTISSLTVTNPTNQTQDVTLVYRVTNQTGLVLANGRSDPQVLPPGPTVFASFVDLSGTSSHDVGVEDQMRRTGRLPEGDYTACVVATDAGGFVLAEACASFSIVYPDPPYLIAPFDDAALTAAHPIFQWTPLQVPIGYRVQYGVRIAEMMANQTPDEALRSNIPLYESFDVGGGATSFEYPIGARPLETGRTYAWRVLALDQNGYAPAANGGMSELWTFRYDDAAGVTPVTPSQAVTLSIANIRGTTGAAGTTPSDAGLTDICAKWDTEGGGPPNITLGVNSPIGFPSSLSLRGALFRYQLPSGSRVWAITGDVQARQLLRVLAYGDCDGPAGVAPWAQWLGIRTAAGAAQSEWLMSADPDTADAASRVPGLEFGVVVFTLQEMTVAAPDGFDVVRDFLQGREFDVKPGVNLLGIQQLEEGSAWDFFQLLGYDQKELEWYGYVGVNTTVSVGFGRPKEGGLEGDVSAELEFVNLHLAFPTREPPLVLRHFFKSMHLELELALKDTVQTSAGTVAGRGTTHQLHLVFNLKHRLELSDGLTQALGLNPGAEFVSSTGLDLGKEWNLRKGGSSPAELKFVQKYALDATWPIGQSGFVVGHPELELDVAIWGPSKGEWSVSFSGSAGWGAQEQLGKVVVTIGRKPKPPLLQSLDRMHANVTRWQERLEFTEGELRKATTAADSAKLQGYIVDYHEWITTEQDHLKTFEGLSATRKLQQRTEAEQPHCFKFAGWYCTFRVSFGNLSLVDLLALIRNATFEAAKP